MNPKLSRRGGRAFQFPPISGMEPAERRALADRITAADSFDDLAEADRMVIEAAEANAATRLR